MKSIKVMKMWNLQKNKALRTTHPQGYCLASSRWPRLSGCFAGYIVPPGTRCCLASSRWPHPCFGLLERHFSPEKPCRLDRLAFGNFSAPLPRGLDRRLHRASRHSMLPRGPLNSLNSFFLSILSSCPSWCISVSRITGGRGVPDSLCAAESKGGAACGSKSRQPVSFQLGIQKYNKLKSAPPLIIPCPHFNYEVYPAVLPQGS